VGGDVFGDKLELLAQPAADDRVVLVEAEGNRFAGENFFANVVGSTLLIRLRSAAAAKCG